MAHAGKTIENPRTRQRLTFLRTASESEGRILEFEVATEGTGAELPPHVHPEQEERIAVLAGAVRLSVDGRSTVLAAGEEATVPRGTAHTWSCVGGGETETRVHVTLTPACDAETFLETMYGLSRDGHTNPKGMPKPLQMAVLAHSHRDEMAFAGAPRILQRAVLGVLAPIGRLAGYQPRYDRYST
jgi:quercetin dioxygenase-like cupin family protein